MKFCICDWSGQSRNKWKLGCKSVGRHKFTRVTVIMKRRKKFAKKREARRGNSEGITGNSPGSLKCVSMAMYCGLLNIMKNCDIYFYHVEYDWAQKYILRYLTYIVTSKLNCI